MSDQNKQPRIAELDAIRGLALWGIFVVNIVWFSIPSERFAELYSGGPYWYNDLINFARTELFGGRTATIFALLFGLGLGMQWNQGRGYLFLLRRNAILALFGILHILLLLGGDILLDYAIFGFVSILLLAQPRKLVLIIALLFLSFPAVYSLLVNFHYLSLYSGVHGGNKLSVEEMVMLFQNGAFLDQLIYRFHQYLTIWQNPWVLHYYFPPVIGCFFIGIYLSKTSFLNSFNKKSLYLKIFLVCLSIKILLSIINHPFHSTLTEMKESFMFTLIFQWDQYMTSFMLISLAVLCAQKWFFQPFKLMGRMSLTTYLLESITAATLFYSFGFAQYNSLTPLQVQLFCLLFTALIVLFAFLWFKRFRWGPAEWLWRIVSYGKKF